MNQLLSSSLYVLAGEKSVGYGPGAFHEYSALPAAPTSPSRPGEPSSTLRDSSEDNTTASGDCLRTVYYKAAAELLYDVDKKWPEPVKFVQDLPNRSCIPWTDIWLQYLALQPTQASQARSKTSFLSSLAQLFATKSANRAPRIVGQMCAAAARHDQNPSPETERALKVASQPQLIDNILFTPLNPPGTPGDTARKRLRRANQELRAARALVGMVVESGGAGAAARAAATPLVALVSIVGFHFFAQSLVPVVSPATLVSLPVPESDNARAHADVSRVLSRLHFAELPASTDKFECHVSPVDGRTYFLGAGSLIPSLPDGTVRLELIQRVAEKPFLLSNDELARDLAAREVSEQVDQFVATFDSADWKDTVDALLAATAAESSTKQMLVDTVRWSRVGRGLLVDIMHRYGLSISRSLGLLWAKSRPGGGLRPLVALEMSARAIKHVWRDGMRLAFEPLILGKSDPGKQKTAASSPAGGLSGVPVLGGNPAMASVPMLGVSPSPPTLSRNSTARPLPGRISQELEGQPWFRPDFDRVSAEKFVSQADKGAFVVRSSSKPDSCALTHRDHSSGIVGHAIISMRGNFFQLETQPQMHDSVLKLLRSLPLKHDWLGGSASSSYGSRGPATALPAAAPAKDSPEQMEKNPVSSLQKFRAPTALLLNSLMQWVTHPQRTLATWRSTVLPAIDTLFGELCNRSEFERLLALDEESRLSSASHVVRAWRESLLDRFRALTGIAVASSARSKLFAPNCPTLPDQGITIEAKVKTLIPGSPALLDDARSLADRPGPDAARALALARWSGALLRACALGTTDQQKARVLEALKETDVAAQAAVDAFGRGSPAHLDLCMCLVRLRALKGDHSGCIAQAKAMEMARPVAGWSALERAWNEISTSNFLSEAGKHHESAAAAARALLALDTGEKASAIDKRSSALARILALSVRGKSAAVDENYPVAADALNQLRELESRWLGGPLGSTLNALGSALFGSGKFADAIRNFEEAVRIARQKYGPSALNVAHTLDNLGNACLKAGKLDEALRHQSQALEIQRQVHGESHASVARCRRNVADLLLADNQRDQALDQYKKALAVFQQMNMDTESKETEALLQTAEKCTAEDARAKLSGQASVKDLSPALESQANGGAGAARGGDTDGPSPPAAASPAPVAPVDYRGLRPRQLMDLCFKRGIPTAGLAKGDVIKALEEHDRQKNGSAATAAAPAEPEKPKVNYRILKPRQIMDLCFKRGISRDGLGKGELIAKLEEWDAANAPAPTAGAGPAAAAPSSTGPTREEEETKLRALNPRQLMDLANKKGVNKPGMSKGELITALLDHKLNKKVEEPKEEAKPAAPAALDDDILGVVPQESAFDGFTYVGNTYQNAVAQSSSSNSSIPETVSLSSAPSVRRLVSRTKGEAQGYLWKKGARRRNWNKRWVELRFKHLAAVPGGFLSYYEDERKSTCKATINMTEVRSVRGDIPPPGAKDTLKRKASARESMSYFEVVTDGRTYYFAIEDHDEMEKWVDAISSWIS